jgi:hypothetical protein
MQGSSGFTFRVNPHPTSGRFLFRSGSTYNQEQSIIRNRFCAGPNKDLERLILARELIVRATAKTRSNSKLLELVDLFLSRTLVTVPLGAKLLKVIPKAIDLMLGQLGGALPRELTGRTRYRAWGIV